MEYYSTIRKTNKQTNKEILPFVATWVNLKGIMLSEKAKERQILYGIICMRNLKKKKKANLTETEWWFPGAKDWEDGET